MKMALQSKNFLRKKYLGDGSEMDKKSIIIHIYSTKFFLLYKINQFKMQKEQIAKYTCGCGKSYSSYPAYSTHKKYKHNNQQVEGTTLPKTFNPKRGRPSFSFNFKPAPTSQRNSQLKFYEGLTVIEIGLMNLDIKFPQRIMSQASQQTDKQMLRIYDDTDKMIVNDQFGKMVQMMKTFNSLLITHMQVAVAEVTTAYLKELVLFMLRNYEIKLEQIRLNWEQNYQERIAVNCRVFNQFYRRRENIQKIKKIGEKANLSVEYFGEVTVLLSEWLLKLGLSDSSLKRRQSISP